MLHDAPTDVAPRTAMRRRLAAVDLGSNSFRVVIADVHTSSAGEQIRVLDQIKDSVRLGAGLDHDQELSLEARERALAALRRFNERLQGFEPDTVRAVATNTFRIARNGESFLAQAGHALGYPIEIIAGREEARLIYVGVSHTLPLDHQLRLVVDIGGGSTECIIGQDHETRRRESFQIGCVGLTREFFADGRISRALMRRARLQAAAQLASQVRAFRRIGWHYAVGTSGTAKSLAFASQALFGSPVISRESLAALEDLAQKAGAAEALPLDLLKPERRAVFAGGLAAMQAVFEEFDLQQMHYCDAALREGLLHDLLGRASGADRREITISDLVERYRMDDVHGRQVAAVARLLIDQLGPIGNRDAQALDWAARIREIGSFIAHSEAHKHGAYVVANADLPGFSGIEQQRLAMLVLGQSGGLRKLKAYAPTPAEWRMVLCLRLAVILQRRRDGRPTPVRIEPLGNGDNRGWRIELARDWAGQHPLTDHSLEAETTEWRNLGVFASVDYALV